MKDIVLQPVGRVISEIDAIDDMIRGGTAAKIEIYPPYQEALYRIEENSHLWILAWFHQAPRDKLRISPHRMDPQLPQYGVFALRTFARPNPVALTLVTLERVEGNLVYVQGLDAISGTPVIDIKPYFENDIVFSPRTSFIRGKTLEMRQNRMYRQALAHHREDCPDLQVAVRMATIAEEHLGQLTVDAVMITVTGSRCLGDCLQGLSRARLSNPPRFTFIGADNGGESRWEKEGSVLHIRLQEGINRDRIRELPDRELFNIDTGGN